MRKTTYYAVLAAALPLLIASGCTATPAPADETASTISATTTETAVSAFDFGTGLIAAAMSENLTPSFETSDTTWDASAEVPVVLSDAGSSGGNGVTVSGSTVTITAPGTYRISGTLSDGQLVIDGTGSGLVRLILDGASITSSTTSAISAKGIDKLVLVLADGTTTSLTDATTYSGQDADGEPDAALFTKSDLVIAGAGTLNVQARAGDGIASKDGLMIVGGTIQISAADDGIRGRDYLVLSDATVTITAGGQGLKATNDTDAGTGYVLVLSGTITITSGATADCVNAVSHGLFASGTLTLACGDDAVHADQLLVVEDGQLSVTQSEEGLESAHLKISGGTLDITSNDDGINAAAASSDSDTTDQAGGGPFQGGGRGGGGGGMGGEAVQDASVEISGGTLTVNAQGDGLDSNGTMTISGGTIIVNGPTGQGNGALDVAGTLTITGGTLAAVGAAGMISLPTTDSAQQWFAEYLNSSAGVAITITTNEGDFSFTPSKGGQLIVFSSPELASGQVSVTSGTTQLSPTLYGG